MFLAWVISICGLDNYKPDISYFSEIVLLDTTGANLNLVMDIFRVAGYCIAIILVIFNIYIVLAGLVIEYKDSVWQIFLRFVLVCFSITISTGLLDNALSVGNELWKYVEDSVGLGTYTDHGKLKGTSMGESWAIFDDAIYEEPDDESDAESEDEIEDSGTSPKSLVDMDDVTDMVGKTTANALSIVLFPLNCIIRAILFLICAYNFLKLFIELAKRYITMSVLYLMFPTACGFLASASTIPIFFNFLRMFAVEIGVLVFTRLWLALCLFLMGNIPSGTFYFFLVIAFINFGIKIESFIKDIGLTISSTGPALLDSVATTAGAMAILGSQAIGTSGGAMTTIGAATGNMNLVAVGNAMRGKSITPEGISRAASESMGGILRNKVSSDTSSSAGTLFKPSNLTDSKKKNLYSLMNDGGRMAKDAFAKELNSGLNSAGRKEMLNSIADTQFGNLQDELDSCGEGCKLNLDSFDPYKGFNATITDADGNAIASGTISDTPGANGSSIGFTGANGAQKFFNLNDSAAPLKPGESISVGENAGNGLTSAELKTGANMSKLSSLYNDGTIKANDMQFTGTADGGFDVYTGCADGGNGKLVAHQYKNGSVAFASQRWGSKNIISDATGKTHSREADFASLFSTNSSGHGSETNSGSIGVFSNMGYNNVRDVEFLNNAGTKVNFQYTDSDGSDRKAQFTQVVGNEATVNTKNIFDGGARYGTWAATQLKTPNIK